MKRLPTGSALSLLLEPTAVIAQYGETFHFDGYNDNVAVNHKPTLKPTAALTIELWINPSDIHSLSTTVLYSKDENAGRRLLAFQNN